MRISYPIVDFYVRMNAASVSENTSENRREKLTVFLGQLEEKYGVVVEARKIAGLTPEVIGLWYAEMGEAGRKMSTLNNYVCMINPFIKWAQKMDYLVYLNDKGMPIDLSAILVTHKIPDEDSVPEWERKPEKYLDHDQARKLIEGTTGRNLVRDRAIIALLLYSGLRVSELCSLTIGSVYDRERGEIYVKRKGGKWCSVLVGLDAYAYLDAYLATRVDADDHSQPLFITTHGKPCNRNQIYKALSFKQKAEGLATGPHALRHTFISESEKLGSASIARDLANQKSLKVTNRYDHTTPAQRREAVDKLSW